LCYLPSAYIDSSDPDATEVTVLNTVINTMTLTRKHTYCQSQSQRERQTAVVEDGTPASNL